MSYSIINFNYNAINNSNNIINLNNDGSTGNQVTNNNNFLMDEINNGNNNEDNLIRLSKTLPSERMGHICVPIKDRFLLVWGGHRYDDSRNEIYLNASLIWIFDIELESWKLFEHPNDENLPPILSGSFPLVLHDSLYLFGGSKRKIIGDSNDYHSNELFELNLNSLKWTRCQMKNGKLPSPRDKTAGWIYNKNFKSRLYYFGGFGSIGSTEQYLGSIKNFSEISNYTRRLGWNNQLIHYDLITQTWHNDDIKDLNNLPLPRAAHTCVKVNKNQVVLFGGRTSLQRCNDLYVLDLNKLKWSKNLMTQTNESTIDKYPVGRSWHTMNKLDDKTLFIYGGLSQKDEALDDAWFLNLDNFTWTRLINKFETRLWHTTVLINHGQLYVYGGSNNDIYLNQPKYPKHIIKISLSPDSLQKICLDLICTNLYKYDLNLLNQIPFHLEANILLKHFNKNGASEYLLNCKKNKYEKLNDNKIIRPSSRSEYCIIS